MSADSFSFDLDETALQELYTWIDEIPLSRPKKNISRDFSDGVLVAEIIHHFVPKVIDLHNYVPANSNQAKTENWNLLTRKILSKLGYHVPNQLIKDIVLSKPGQIEKFLHKLRHKIETFQAKKKAAALREKDQVYDEIGGEVSSRTEDYFSDNYQYSDGQSSYRSYINGQNGNFGQDHNLMNYGSTQGPYPPQNAPNQQLQQQQQQYYFQSEPRATPDERVLRQVGGGVTRNHKQMSDTSLGPKQKEPGRLQGGQPMNEVQLLKLALEEKEQALLSSQETVQILQVKVRRLEHLLHLKDLRIDDLSNKLNLNHHVSPQSQISPQHAPSQAISSSGQIPHNLPPQSYGQMPPIRQHPPLPGIAPRTGLAKHYR